MRFFPLGDTAIVVEFGTVIGSDTHDQVRLLSLYLDEHPMYGMIEYVPAFTTVTVFYNPVLLRYSEAQKALESAAAQSLQMKLEGNVRTVDIPVCYGGSFGPDLEEVASHNELSPDEVVRIHSSGEYVVYLLGFAPGFPFLGGMSQRISTPRRSTPRLAIPSGTVGIAGMQTGVYPIVTPGGWQLIGRTPVPLFRPDMNPPTLLRTGDSVRFLPITEEEYKKWEGHGTCISG
ncbi:5-oxoprolinase subunit PxpB [Paenibacillus alvei]|uniref:5-oxoprolinase subunit PxpB n=1 Tax=Paenibacillus alvei TaxID=44250 RepID=UPI0018CEAA93|nr:5-oxoprolinase subunit PxpB [Paenibacillus alvei]MBG9737339.1 kinase inhibitor [Paenibacillus alvei]MBG9746118.1 kinase inhibitor [Paenibacillus alvei]MCY7487458.1 5-oxoprolinase subunit PxpB [Paenibacillus alvei]MCY9579131.1 5-oxoprolinase subunit PxpB [Paenibacillus alvei]MCY9583558.1 5-oxoprolinase subunit PxpB [Paenibacillus alvei]